MTITHCARRTVASSIALTTLLVVGTATALPQEPCYEQSDRAWLPPVDDAAYALACETWHQGSQLEDDAFFERAIPVLERSLAAWDVPRTRLVLARALLNVGRSEESLRHAWSAMSLGGRGLSAEEVETVSEIERYSLDQSLVHVVIIIEDTSTVRVGDRIVVTGPARWHGIIAPIPIRMSVWARDAKRLEAYHAPRPGDRLAITVPAPAPGNTNPPQLDAGPRRQSEVRDLMLSLVGFAIDYPNPQEQSASRPRSNEGNFEPVELPPEAAARCERAKTRNEKRLCELHSADRRLFATRINAVEAERIKTIHALRRMTR